MSGSSQRARGTARPANGSGPKVDTDVSGRPVELRTLDLHRFFHPRLLAVIGASDTPGRPNTLITRRLQEWAQHRGASFRPVNPNRETVHGLACATSLADVEGDIDVAVILTGDVLGAVEEAVDCGAHFAIAFGAGFAEVGDEGRDAQDRLSAMVAASTLHLLGPNTNLNAFEEVRTDLPAPKIALISQSGHQGRPIFQAEEIGIGLSAWAPTGNEVDLEFADFARYFADQPEVGAIAAYIEGFKDGRTLMLAADHAARVGTPIVVVKVGRTDEGASMAQSHTGKLTGSDEVISAVFRQFGVTRVDGLDEMLDTAQLFCRAPSPPAHVDSPGVAIYAISGGTGAHLADLAAAAGLRMPTLSDALQETLYEWIPRYLRVSNPIDNGGHPVGDERGRLILDALVADPDIDVLIAPITGAFPPMSDRLALDLVEVAERTDKPICVIWGSPVGTEGAYREILLGSSKVAVFRTFGNCITAVKAWADWHRFRHGYCSPFATPPLRASKAAPAARALLGGATAGSEQTAKQLLTAYGIPVTRDLLATSASEAASAAGAIGFPVVMKIASPDIDHKSDLGLVVVGVASASGARSTFRSLLAMAQEVAPTATIDGVLVSEMVSGGVETVVGLSRDELFGPTVVVGLGGIFVEVLHDVSFRVPPFDRKEAHRLLAELRGAPVLSGTRGRPPADVDALVDVIMKVQRLGLDLAHDLAELDINPLVVRARGEGAIALDALAIPIPT